MAPPLVNCGYVYTWGTGLMGQVGNLKEHTTLQCSLIHNERQQNYFIEVVNEIDHVFFVFQLGLQDCQTFSHVPQLVAQLVKSQVVINYTTLILFVQFNISMHGLLLHFSLKLFSQISDIRQEHMLWSKPQCHCLRSRRVVHGNVTSNTDTLPTVTIAS